MMALVLAVMLHFSALWMAAAGGYGADRDKGVTLVFWTIAGMLALMGIWVAF